MVSDEARKLIEGLSDVEIRESVVLGETGFQPGVYDIYLSEARKRGIDVLEETKKNDKNNSIVSAPVWKRLLNYWIDGFVVVVPTVAIFAVPVQNALISPVYVLLGIAAALFLYYSICETRYGRTLGKLITRTRVVSLDGGKPAAGQILKRTFARAIPLNGLVTLLSGLSIHDRISETKCVDNTTPYVDSPRG